MTSASTSNLLRAAALVAALSVGFAARFAGLPLAFVLGPLVVTAIFSVSGVDVIAPVRARQLGQMIIGATIGLYVTPGVALALLTGLPVMIGVALVTVVTSTLFGAALSRFAGLDARTGYLAMLPGGLSEMAVIGAKVGARAEAISLCQSLRVAVVVLVTPLIVLSLRGGGDTSLVTLPDWVALWTIPVLLLAGLAGALVLRRVGLNNPWMVGTAVVVGVLAATNVVGGRMPEPVFFLGQFLIGINIGARFRRNIVAKLPRIAFIAVLLLLAYIMLLAGFALLLAAVTAVDPASAILALSPGGLAEMSALAQTLHQSAILVTGFHVVRSLLVNTLAMPIFGLLNRVGILRDERND